MIRFVTQGISVAFLLFFYCVGLSADIRITPPIQLVVETDKNQLYQHSQLLVTLHIFHQEPLPETVDIIPPQLEGGRVRVLGLPYTRIEPGPIDDAYHTTQSYALFPGDVGNLSSTGPSVRLPSSLDQASQTLRAEIPNVNVLALPQGIERLSSENLILSDTAHPLARPDLGYVRRVSITAVATLPYQLPDRILVPSDQQNYRLIERFVDEYHSKQGVTSLLQELWHVTPVPNTSTSQPVSSIVWLDTESKTLRQTQSALPSMAMTVEITENTSIPEESSAIAEIVIDASTSNPIASNENTPFWLQVAVGFTLLTVVSLAILAGFRFQLGRKIERRNTLHSPKNRPHQANKGMQKPNDRRLDNSFHHNTTVDTPSVNTTAEGHAFKALTEACQQNACYQAKTAIILWAACFWPDKGITQTESIYQANISQTLNYLLLDLEHHIKQSQEEAWRGDLLLEAVKTLRRRRMT